MAEFDLVVRGGTVVTASDTWVSDIPAIDPERSVKRYPDFHPVVDRQTIECLHQPRSLFAAWTDLRQIHRHIRCPVMNRKDLVGKQTLIL